MASAVEGGVVEGRVGKWRGVASAVEGRVGKWREEWRSGGVEETSGGKSYHQFKEVEGRGISSVGWRGLWTSGGKWYQQWSGGRSGGGDWWCVCGGVWHRKRVWHRL